MAKKFIVYLEKIETKEIEVTIADDISSEDFRDWASNHMPLSFDDYDFYSKIKGEINNKETEITIKVFDEYDDCNVTNIREL